LTLLFPAGLEGDINRFFIERVDSDADHSTLYLLRGSFRVGFAISASVLREGLGSLCQLPPVQVTEGMTDILPIVAADLIEKKMLRAPRIVAG
jgi:hypothetical protein